jgi:hypothetical protein
MSIKLDRMWDARLRQDIDGSLKYGDATRVYKRIRRDPVYREIPDDQLRDIVMEQAGTVTAKDIIGAERMYGPKTQRAAAFYDQGKAAIARAKSNYNLAYLEGRTRAASFEEYQLERLKKNPRQ